MIFFICLSYVLIGIKCKIHEAELEDKKSRFEQQMYHIESMLEAQEKRLLEYETSLQERESKLREHESRVGTLNNYPHPQLEQNNIY